MAIAGACAFGKWYYVRNVCGISLTTEDDLDSFLGRLVVINGEFGWIPADYFSDIPFVRLGDEAVAVHLPYGTPNTYPRDSEIITAVGTLDISKEIDLQPPPGTSRPMRYRLRDARWRK